MAHHHHAARHANPLVTGLEQGVVAILGSKSGAALLRFSAPHELLLTGGALLAVLHAARGFRVGRILAQVVYTITLDAALRWASSGADKGLALAQLMAVFFWTQALQRDGDLALTAQYLLVARLAAVLHRREYLPVAWALAFAPAGGVLGRDLAQIAQLVSVDTLSAFLSDWLPRDLLLLTTASLLYLCAPFAEEFPSLDRLFRFAVFAFANDTQLAGLPPWLLAAGLWALWQAEPSRVARRLASVAGCNMAVLAALDALRFAMDDDPAPTLVALLVAIRVVAAQPLGGEEGSS